MVNDCGASTQRQSERGVFCKWCSPAAITEMMECGELVDVVLRPRPEWEDWSGTERGVRELPVHGLVMSLVSPVMRKMIQWQRERVVLRDGNDIIVLELDASFSTLECFVDFVYRSRADVRGGATELIALGRLADQLDVQGLREVVVAQAWDMLSTETCALFLNAGRHDGLPELLDIAMQFALRHFTDMAHTPSFALLHDDVLEDLLVDDRLEATEESVYTVLLSWMAAGPAQEETDLSAKRVSDLKSGKSADAETSEKTGKEQGPPVHSLLREERLLACVRFEHLSREFLCSRVLADAELFRSAALAARAEQVLVRDEAQSLADVMQWQRRGGFGPGVRALAAQRVALTAVCHAGAVEALEYYAGRIISGSCDGKIKLTDSADGREVGALTLPGGASLGAVYSLLAVGGALVSGGQCRGGIAMHLWDLGSWQHSRALPGHDDAVMNLTVSPSGALFSASWDGSIREWDRTTWTSKRCLVPQPAPSAMKMCPVMQLACCRADLVLSDLDGVRILQGGARGGAHSVSAAEQEEDASAAGGVPPYAWTWRALQGGSGVKLPGMSADRPDKVRTLVVGSGPAAGAVGSEQAYRSQGRLFTGHSSGEIRVWNTATWEYVGTLRGHGDAVSALATWGHWVVSGSVDGTVRVWDPAAAEGGEVKRQCIKSIDVHSEVVTLAVRDGLVLCGQKDRCLSVIRATPLYTMCGG